MIPVYQPAAVRNACRLASGLRLREGEIQHRDGHDAEVHSHCGKQALRDLFAASAPSGGTAAPMRAPRPDACGGQQAKQDDPHFHAWIVAGLPGLTAHVN